MVRVTKLRDAMVIVSKKDIVSLLLGGTGNNIDGDLFTCERERETQLQ
jgi:hypothetical protein